MNSASSTLLNLTQETKVLAAMNWINYLMDAHMLNKKQARQDVCEHCHFTVPMREVHRHGRSIFICRWMPTTVGSLCFLYRKNQTWHSQCGSSPIHTCCLTFIQWVSGGPQPRADTSHLILFILATSLSLSLSQCEGSLTCSGLVWLKPILTALRGEKGTDDHRPDVFYPPVLLNIYQIHKENTVIHLGEKKGEKLKIRFLKWCQFVRSQEKDLNQ